MGRDESNSPNSLDSCSDGTRGTHLVDESIESIAVRSLSSTQPLREGATAEIVAVVWPWTNGYYQDTADFYYADNADDPYWVLIGSAVPTGNGYQTLAMRYTIPPGDGVQAVRVNFRWRGRPGGGYGGSCSGGNYDDVDDLAFAVASFADASHMAQEEEDISMPSPPPEPIDTPSEQVFTCDSLDRSRCTSDMGCVWNRGGRKKKGRCRVGAKKGWSNDFKW